MKLIQVVRSVCMTLIMGVVVATVSGCQKQEGPLERAGKEVDKAVEKVGQQVEKTGESIKDTANGDKK